MDKDQRKIYYINSKKKALEAPEIPDNELNRYKLKYVCYRLGRKFSFDDMKKMKIIFSLADFLDHNELYPNMRCSNYLSILNKDYIGFLANTSGYIVFRNTMKTDNVRYFKYNIFDAKDPLPITYVIPGTSANMFDPVVNLNICEGPFDALGLYYNTLNKLSENQIYAACCGSGYNAAIKHFIKLGFIGNLNVNIYSDSDKSPDYYKAIKMDREILPWVRSINLYYNRLSKDYGVPKDEIDIVSGILPF